MRRLLLVLEDLLLGISIWLLLEFGGLIHQYSRSSSSGAAVQTLDTVHLKYAGRVVFIRCVVGR